MTDFFPSQEVQGLDPGAEVELLEVDCSLIGGGIYRFVPGKSPTGAPVTWGGEVYTPFPVQGSGWDVTTQGTIPRPKLQVSAVDGLIGSLIRGLDDMLGAKVTRILTLVKFLDPCNFPNGNTTANPDAVLRRDVYLISQKTAETRDVIEFELASPLDTYGLRLPARPLMATICPWQYRGLECGYAGAPVAAADDTSTSDPALDACSHRISGCKLRFGAHGDLPFGGFPGAGIT